MPSGCSSTAPDQDNDKNDFGRETLTYSGEFRMHWPNLMAACFGMALGSAFNHYMTSLFGPAMIKELGWSKADFALIGSLPLVLMFTVPLAGRFVDMVGPRTAAIVGFTGVPLGFVAMAFMNGSVTQYFVIYALQHVFGILTTSMVFCRVIVERFDAARGMALSVVMSAPPLAGAIGAPIMGGIIAEQGWRYGFFVMAAVAVVGGVIAVAMMGRSARQAATKKEERSLTGAELKDLLRNRTLLLVIGGMFLVNIPQVFASSQMKLVVMDSGVSDSLGTWMVSLYATGVIIGRFASGLALDRISPHLVAIAALGLPAIGYLIFASHITETGVLIGAIMVIGLAQGAEADIGAYLISRRFDMKNFSLLLSFMTMMIGLGSAAGSLVMSVTLRMGHGYTTFLWVSAVATVIGAVLFAMTGSSKADRSETRHETDEAVLDQSIAGEFP